MDEVFRHLLVRKTERVEHDRPVNAVRGAQDVFADNVQRGPFLRNSVGLLSEISFRRVIPDEADVIHQGVEPDEVDEPRSNGSWMPQLKRDFGREMHRSPLSFSTALMQFDLTEIGRDTIGMGREETEQPFSVFGEMKVIVFLNSMFDLAPLGAEFAVGTAFLVG